MSETDVKDWEKSRVIQDFMVFANFAFSEEATKYNRELEPTEQDSVNQIQIYHLLFICIWISCLNIMPYDLFYY